MFYILAYRVDRKTKTIKIGDEAAARVRAVMASGDANAFITLGLETIRVGNISNLSAESGDTSDKAIADLRRRLIAAAKDCLFCQGVGFVDEFISETGEVVPKWEPRCENRKKSCVCQTKAKEAAGIPLDETGWHYRDKAFNTKEGGWGKE